MELTKKRSFTLQCPMPKLEFDIITLGHGSGIGGTRVVNMLAGAQLPRIC